MSTVTVAVRNAGITQDPVLKQVGSTSLLTLNVGWKKTWEDKAGKKQEKKGYIEIRIWGAAADKAYEVAEKYGTVTCFGVLEMEQWDDRETGKKRYKHFITPDMPTWDSLFIFPAKPFEGEQQSRAPSRQQANTDFDPSGFEDEEIKF
jgi:single stranded DNA-binding protein